MADPRPVNRSRLPWPSSVHSGRPRQPSVGVSANIGFHQKANQTTNYHHQGQCHISIPHRASLFLNPSLIAYSMPGAPSIKTKQPCSITTTRNCCNQKVNRWNITSNAWYIQPLTSTNINNFPLSSIIVNHHLQSRELSMLDIAGQDPPTRLVGIHHRATGHHVPQMNWFASWSWWSWSQKDDIMILPWLWKYWNIVTMIQENRMILTWLWCWSYCDH